MSATPRDYSHRSVVDKLGIKSGHMVAVVQVAGHIGDALRRQIEERVNRPLGVGAEAVDVVLITADRSTDLVALLREWRGRIQPAGGIWVLTPKRGQPGYLNGTDLIPMGAEAGLVDNKTCSVDEVTSGMRFVIRRSDR